MPQLSYAFAISRMRSKQAKLLSAEQVGRIFDAVDAEEAFKLLVETGYGNEAQTGSDLDFEALVSRELSEAFDFVREVTPEPELTAAFSLKYDIHNIKCAVKARSLGIQDAPLIELGNVPVETVRIAVRDGDYKLLPNYLKFVGNYDSKSGDSFDPQEFCFEADKELIREMIRIAGNAGNKFFNKYVAAYADFSNVIAFLRAKKAKDITLVGKTFVDGGAFIEEYLTGRFDQQPEVLAVELAKGQFSDKIAEGIEYFGRTGSTAMLEKLRDDSLLKLAEPYKYEVFTLEPLIGYLLGKEREASAIRLVMTAKINKLDTKIVTERLRELYE